MDQDERAANALKVRENRLRRMARRQGLELVKSRRRDPRAIDYGCWYLVDPDNNALVAGDSCSLPSLDDVEEALTNTTAEQRREEKAAA